jgi:hypothetical protein
MQNDTNLFYLYINTHKHHYIEVPSGKSTTGGVRILSRILPVRISVLQKKEIHMIKRTVFLSVLIILGVFFTPALAWTLDSGYDTSASIYGGVRYRAFNNFGGEQVYIGIPTVLDDDTWGSEKNKDNYFWRSTNAFTIRYTPHDSDPAKSVITSTIGPTSYTLSAAGPVNYIEFVLVNANSGNYVDYEVTKINNEPVSYVFTGTGTKYWSVQGTGSQSLSIDGYIYKHGLPGGDDSSYGEIRLGYLAPKDDEAPPVTSVRISPDPVVRCHDVTVTAIIDDAATGGSAIGSAEYAADGGAWTSMGPADGAFDESTEGVTATLATDRSWAPGVHSVCVRGMDGNGNPSDGMACNAFTTGYSVDGFYQPVDMADTNSARAGQTIPAEWTLSDACGVIEDPASFSNLYSYPVTCGELSPVTDVIELYAGSSGLQYFGDGLWQFNWKTPKTYAGTCRVMHVGFNDGQYSDIVQFKFK